MKISYGPCNDKFSQILGETDSFPELHKIIHAFLKERNERIYYQRINFIPECWQLDFGSHMYFIWISELPDDAVNKYLENA